MELKLCSVGSLVVVVWVFLFFKQKTAYEVRISDWCSDVCSSDLTIGRLTIRYFLFLSAITAVNAQSIRIMRLTSARLTATLERRKRTNQEQIGRASCRERVCR